MGFFTQSNSHFSARWTTGLRFCMQTQLANKTTQLCDLTKGTRPNTLARCGVGCLSADYRRVRVYWAPFLQILKTIHAREHTHAFLPQAWHRSDHQLPGQHGLGWAKDGSHLRCTIRRRTLPRSWTGSPRTNRCFQNKILRRILPNNSCQKMVEMVQELSQEGAPVARHCTLEPLRWGQRSQHKFRNSMPNHGTIQYHRCRNHHNLHPKCNIPRFRLEWAPGMVRMLESGMAQTRQWDRATTWKWRRSQQTQHAPCSECYSN